MTINNEPLVTVGIPIYNHENYIKECIVSIIRQTYTNIELIIIDDGSNDNSYQIAKEILETQDNFKMYTIIKRENRGMCNTLNEIAHMAKGKYISFIGSDDFWHKDKIQDQTQFLEDNPHIYLVHSNSIIVDKNSQEISKIDYSKKINKGNVFQAIVMGKGGINTPSHLYKTKVFEKIGYYDPSFRFEDTDFWLRLTKIFEIGFINKYHSYYRWHGKNLSDGKNKLKFYNEEIIKIFQKNIDDANLKKYSILRIYRKSYLLALRKFKLLTFVKYVYKYLKLSLFNK